MLLFNTMAPAQSYHQRVETPAVATAHPGITQYHIVDVHDIEERHTVTFSAARYDIWTR